MTTNTTQQLEFQPTPVPCVSRYNARTFTELAARVAEIDADGFLVQNLIPRRSLSGLFGDSGLGKTPFMYQLLMCVAAGIDFVGLKVEKGRVLYLGSEDGLNLTKQKLAQIAKHLNLSEVPENLITWSLNDTASNYGVGGGGHHDFYDIIREQRPILVVIDTITIFCPKIEDSSTVAASHIAALRKIISDVGCSIIFLHHLRKHSDDQQKARTSLENTGDLGAWFEMVRGAGGIVGNIDARIGFDKPATNGADVVIRGRLRGGDEFPMMLLGRTYDKASGNVEGYHRLGGIDLMANAAYRSAFEELPDRFRFKDALAALGGKSASSTAKFLKNCQGIGILQKVGDYYLKPLPATPIKTDPPRLDNFQQVPPTRITDNFLLGAQTHPIAEIVVTTGIQ